MNLCMGCMKELKEDTKICPYCGYEMDKPRTESLYLEPGTVLQDRYIVGKVLGHGGFGVTYIGFDMMLGRAIAVKEYFPGSFATRVVGTRRLTVYSGAAQEEFHRGLESFVSEAKKLARFTDIPQIVGIYDCIMENGTGYIIMELLEGRTVKEIQADRGCFDYEEAVDIILPVLDGLIAVHRAGIIHRDISPDNIMITEEGKVKLLDFGAARHTVNAHSLSLSVILKPGYAPEEQYRSNGDQGPWTDVYGVGATLYRMITGLRPDEALERVMDDKLKSPSQLGFFVPEYAERALMQSLAVRKDYRIQSAQELKDRLLYPEYSVPRPEPVSGGVSRPDVPPKKKKSSLPVIISVIAVVALVVVAAEWVLLEKVFNGKDILNSGGSAQSQSGSKSPDAGGQVSGSDGAVDDELEYLENAAEDGGIDVAEPGSTQAASPVIIQQSVPQTEPDVPDETAIHRYEYVYDDCTWREAYEACRARGGYLVRINTKEEYDYIKKELKEKGYNKGKFFLGGRRDSGSSRYYWIDENNNLMDECLNDSSKWYTSTWLTNEPSFKDGSSEEYYLQMFYYESAGGWVWNDIPNDIISLVPTYSGTVGYICEYDE